ncbi:MAG TPA: AAA family ATPase [Verrucomicrobiales bacterium]|nr:AAA family ATPase [Verrucomicrobiales bacterium]
MTPTLCIMGGCNGAGKTTLARELLPRLGLMRFLNADEIARGLSPLDPTLSAFKAGRLVIEEARTMIAAGASFALESTLSGKTYAAMLRAAKERGYHIVLHYVMIASAAQAVERVRLRVRMGGHDVPPDDVARRYERSLRHFISDYLPLADEWGVWENTSPPPRKIAGNKTHSIKDLIDLLNATNLMESNPPQPDPMSAMVLEAGRVATEKMLDYYKRMGIKVTPQMTLAPEPKKRVRKAKTGS